MEKAAMTRGRDAIADGIVESIFTATRAGGDPNEYYARLRERHRVYYAADRDMWIITGFAEVDQVLRSPLALLRFERRMGQIRPDWRDHPASANLEGVIAFVDGEPHQKIRKALTPSWTKAEMERIRPHIRAQARRLVERFVGDGGGDFSAGLAHPMAEDTLYLLFGMDQDTPRQLPGLVNVIQLAFEFDVTPEQLRDADAAAVEMREFWKAEYLKRVGNPGDDMLSRLARNPDFSVDEGILIAESLYVGGFDTTALTATTGMWLLVNNRDELERARRDPAALDRLPDEVLRMGPPVPMTVRVAIDDLAVGGETIPKDSLMGVVLMAANRDPAIFPDPERFDLTRPRSRIMTFSSGVHTCLGHFLASMDLFELYRALLDQTTRIEEVGRARFRARQSVRGIENLVLAVA
jgi:cytochrome P450